MDTNHFREIFENLYSKRELIAEILFWVMGLLIIGFIIDYVVRKLKKRAQYQYRAINRLRKRLTFNERGEVIHDPDSRKPKFVAYNTIRFEIATAKIMGENSLMTNLSNACWAELMEDGYIISLVPRDSLDRRHKIEW